MTMLLNSPIVFPRTVKSHSKDTSPSFEVTCFSLGLQLLNTSELLNKVVILIPKSFPNSCNLSWLWRVKAIVKIQSSLKLIGRESMPETPFLSEADRWFRDTCGITKWHFAYLCVSCLSSGSILLVIDLMQLVRTRCPYRLQRWWLASFLYRDCRSDGIWKISIKGMS